MTEEDLEEMRRDDLDYLVLCQRWGNKPGRFMLTFGWEYRTEGPLDWKAVLDASKKTRGR